MAKISGTTSEDGRIYVINQDTRSLEYSHDVVAGPYNIRNLSEGHKTIVFTREDGESRSFGEVSSIYEPGALYVFGYNSDGQLGLNDRNNRSIPTQLSEYTEWKDLSVGGSSSFLIKTDGTMWACGYNYYGQFGMNDRTSRSVFTQVGSDTDWVSVRFNSISFAIKTDGTLWTCGWNAYGQLGLGLSGVQLAAKSTFTQVGNDTNWLSANGGASSVALKLDGTLWSCGFNDGGQLGQGDLTHRSTFTQIGTDSDWASFVAGGSIFAIKTNGTLWSCGSNTYGHLGHNDRSTRSTLHPVGSDADWKITVASNTSSAAIKHNGTLWTCGLNNVGQLGLGPGASHKSTFTQVGSDTNWRSVSCGGDFTVAIKTDGTLWSCGAPTYYKLGLGDLVYRSTFTQIGTDTDWESVTCGNNHTLCKK